MKRVRLTLIWSGCIEFIFAKCPCLIWFPFRPDRIDVYRLIGDVGLVWWSSWRQATKQTNEGTNKESIGQSKDEYTCMCFHLLRNVDVQVYQEWNACMFTHSNVQYITRFNIQFTFIYVLKHNFPRSKKTKLSKWDAQKCCLMCCVCVVDDRKLKIRNLQRLKRSFEKQGRWMALVMPFVLNMML